MAGVWAVGVALIAFVAVGLARSNVPGMHVLPMVIDAGCGLVAGVTMLLRPAWFRPVVVRVVVVVGMGMLVLGDGLAGPGFQVVLVASVVGAVLGPLYLGRWWSVTVLAVFGGGYGILFAVGSGYPAALSRWLILVGTTTSGAAVSFWIMNHVAALAVQERSMHAQLEQAHREVRVLNQELEARVAAQVAEIGGLNQLRRFLAPQVAEAVLNAGDDTLLAPHRRQIAVFFCDLRGFTAFTSNAEPEELHDAISDYYEIVGRSIRQYQATVGTFAGDGIMAFFNDPVLCEDPAGAAVAMAMDLQAPMRAFVHTWERRGYSLGFGVGIAYGFATLGMIGFEGRSDYTAIGAVVNLASRLCAEAGDGHVLIDVRTRHALAVDLPVQGRELALKGVAAPVTAFEFVS